MDSHLSFFSNRKGNTALHEAVLLGPDGQEAIEALLEGTANPKTKNAKGETPYDLAVKNGYDSIVALFASSLGQDMLDKMSGGKGGKEKAKAKKKAKAESEEEEEEFVVKKRKAYKEKLPKVGAFIAEGQFYHCGTSIKNGLALSRDQLILVLSPVSGLVTCSMANITWSRISVGII